MEKDKKILNTTLAALITASPVLPMLLPPIPVISAPQLQDSFPVGTYKIEPMLSEVKVNLTKKQEVLTEQQLKKYGLYLRLPDGYKFNAYWNFLSIDVFNFLQQLNDRKQKQGSDTRYGVEIKPIEAYGLSYLNVHQTVNNLTDEDLAKIDSLEKQGKLSSSQATYIKNRINSYRAYPLPYPYILGTPSVLDLIDSEIEQTRTIESEKGMLFERNTFMTDPETGEIILDNDGLPMVLHLYTILSPLNDIFQQKTDNPKRIEKAILYQLRAAADRLVELLNPDFWVKEHRGLTTNESYLNTRWLKVIPNDLEQNYFEIRPSSYGEWKIIHPFIKFPLLAIGALTLATLIQTVIKRITKQTTVEDLK